MHSDAQACRKRALRQSHLTTPSVRRSVKVLNATAGWDRCRRPRAVIPRDTLATQKRLFPAHPVIRSILRTEAEPGPLHLTYPSTASWMECDHRRPIHRPEAIRRPARIVAPFFDQFFRTLFSRQLEIARTRRRLPPQQHLPEDTGHARVTSEFADVGRCPARIPRIEMFPASVDKLFLHRFSLQ